MSSLANLERSVEQRRAALTGANKIRTKRAQMKLEIRGGHASVLDIIQAPPLFANTMKVYDLLRAAPKLGPVKINKLLSECRVSPSKTLGGMTDRQRAYLASALEGGGVR